MDITTQEAINVKHDYYLMERDKNMFTQLASVLIAWARGNSLFTYNDIVLYTGSIDISNGYTPDLTGLKYLQNVSEIHAQNSSIQTLDRIITLSNLSVIDLSGNAIAMATDIDLILADARYLYDHSGHKISSIDLSGGTNASPTNGTSDSNYTYLTGKGVTVNIN